MTYFFFKATKIKLKTKHPKLEKENVGRAKTIGTNISILNLQEDTIYLTKKSENK